MARKPASESVKKLKRAVALAEQIEKLQNELDSILGGTALASDSAPVGRRGRPPGSKNKAASPASPARKKPRFSAAARARIAAAQRARWAKIKKEKAAQGK